MNDETEEQVTQNEPVEEAPQAEALTPEEIAELKKRASQSSQNYERAKKAEEEKKALEQRLSEAQLAQDSFMTEDEVSKKLRELDSKFSRIEEKTRLDATLQKYPSIADKLDEFNEYRAEYPADKMEMAAKLFLAEKDLLDETPKRKGLEKAIGGRRVTPPIATSNDDVKRLRENNYREYLKQLRSGKLNVG